MLPPQDPVMLHLTCHSLLQGFILLTIGSWVGEAANLLTPVNIPSVSKGRHPPKVRPTSEAAILILFGVGDSCYIGERLFLNNKVP